MGINYSPKIVTDSLVLCLDALNTKSYPGSGTTWFDLSPYKAHGTLVNSPTFNSEGSFSFNGTSSHVTLSKTLPIAQSLYSSTIEILAYRNSITPFEVMFGGGTQSANNGFYFGFRASSSNFMYAYYSNDQDSATPTTNIAWNHYVATYNVTAASRYRYYNSTLLSPSQDSGITNTASSNFAIGAYQIAPGNIASYFSGKIALVRVYNRALTQTEVQQNFNALRGRFGI